MHINEHRVWAPRGHTCTCYISVPKHNIYYICIYQVLVCTLYGGPQIIQDDRDIIIQDDSNLNSYPTQA